MASHWQRTIPPAQRHCRDQLTNLPGFIRVDAKPGSPHKQVAGLFFARHSRQRCGVCTVVDTSPKRLGASIATGWEFA